MQHFAVETDHVLFAEKRLYILHAPDEQTAQQMVNILIETDSGRYISNVDTLNNVAGIKCIYVDVEYETQGETHGRVKKRKLRSGSKRVGRNKRIPFRKRSREND